MSEADVLEAKLEGADHSRANLTEAGLRAANLTGAKLSTANLSYAVLDGAKLAGGRLKGYRRAGAPTQEMARFEAGWEGVLGRVEIRFATWEEVLAEIGDGDVDRFYRLCTRFNRP